MRNRNHRFMLILVALHASFFAAPAFAYLDPGTGSALLQGILGALAAIGVALKLYWHRVLRFLGIRKKRDAVGQGQDSSARSSAQAEQDSSVSEQRGN